MMGQESEPTHVLEGVTCTWMWANGACLCVSVLSGDGVMNVIRQADRLWKDCRSTILHTNT